MTHSFDNQRGTVDGKRIEVDRERSAAPPNERSIT